jgi:16S rRNA (guanine1207-N2)-methyltransferase
MSSDHYFSQEPTSNYQAKTIDLDINGSVFQVSTASGTFSPLRLDTGTEVLLQQLDLAPLDGNILDLGCGWGPIALNLAKRSPKATIWAVDVNQRSLELTAKNAIDLGLSNVKTASPEQVPESIRFSGIWSNPPIRIGKKPLHEMLLHWIPKLEVAGSAYLVVQKNLGSDSLQKWLQATLDKNYEVSRLTSIKTYRVIKVKKIS